ncbi:MAG: Flp pilus assembly protein CpaB [Elusimicrobiota bacterium]|jgi:pilus assembly protein CpaB|nr:Flp pilus assembly protein CpaB [Elusimicrobiota bacterium]
MNKKSVMMPFFIAFVAALLYWFVLYLAQSQIRKTQAMETVLVAQQDIKEGRQMIKGYVKEQQIPVAYVQKDAYRGADLSNIENLVTRIDIPRGSQVTKSALMSLSPESGISLRVLPNFRAFILNVDNNVISLIKPNDKVDVLLTFDAVLKSGGKEKMTATILQDVSVLGVGNNLGQGMDAAGREKNANRQADASAFTDRSALSLALSPIEAQYLALAKEEGEITITVRSAGDTKLTPLEISSFSKLFQ